MSERMGLTEFFAMEAGEYLDRLDALVSPQDAPNAGDVVRTARALRGSALMAQQQGIAGATAALENLARSIDEGRRSWGPDTKQLMVRAVDDLRIFVRNVATWSDDDEAKANALAEQLDEAAGRSSAAYRAPVEQGLDAGTRAFIGREGASVASALDHAAKMLQQNPTGFDPLLRALELMKPLRGLASLAEVPPLPEILDGVGQAIDEIMNRAAPVDDDALLLNAAAQALSRAAQEAATVGMPEQDAAEARNFAKRLSQVTGMGDEIVPIEALFFADNGPHLVKQGTRPNRPAELGRLELVSHGEHLQQAAVELEQSDSPVLQSLRAQALGGTFRALSNTGGGELHEAIGRFAYAASDAIGRGAVVAHTEQFVSGLRDAAQTLVGIQRGNEAQLVDQMLGVVALFQGLAGTSGAVEAVETTHAPYSRPATVSGAAAEVRITPPGVPQTEPPSHAAPESDDLTGSWVRYQGLLDSRGPGTPDLAALVSATAGAAAPSPTATATAETSATVTDAAEPDVVDVASIEYAGAAAVDRAKSLRNQIRQHLASGSPNTAVLDSLIEELTDLVELAQHEDH